MKGNKVDFELGVIMAGCGEEVTWVRSGPHIH